MMRPLSRMPGLPGSLVIMAIWPGTITVIT